ncbi:MAG TPA: hypothetical protein VJT74_02675 [Pyrinomonadaceae bacterium]|nr:hypothetical protein [Pyrinomonadaceae bacterium]
MLTQLVSLSIFLAQEAARTPEEPASSPLLSGPFFLGLVLGIVIGALATLVIKLSRNKAAPVHSPQPAAKPKHIRRCPKCNSTYTDESLLYCVSDGTALVAAGGQAADPNATIAYPQARRTD